MLKMERPSTMTITNTENIEQPKSNSQGSFFKKKEHRKIIKNRLAFWMLGVNNHIGFSTVITAAKDIIFASTPRASYVANSRNCCVIGTGFILLSITLPAFIIILLQTCMGKCVRFSLPISVALSISGCILVAVANNAYLSFPGVVLISLSFGTNSYQMRRHSNLYETNVSKYFRSGCLDGLVIGPFFYALLRFCGVSVFYCFITLPIVPVLGTIFFWCLLGPPPSPALEGRADSRISLSIFDVRPKLENLSDKIWYNFHLLKFFIPLGFIMLCDGLIVDGLYEFLFFNHSFIETLCQYRILVFIYFLGFYACLVTRNLINVRYVTLNAIVHCFIAAYFICEIIFRFTRFLWIATVVVYLQGINSGIAYTSTANRIQAKEPWSSLNMAKMALRNFSLIMLALSSAVSYELHYYFSRTPQT